MYDAAKYCLIRSQLEEHAFSLTAKLCDVTERLCGLIGVNHQEFLATRSTCLRVRNALSESRHHLGEHRTAHGC